MRQIFGTDGKGTEWYHRKKFSSIQRQKIFFPANFGGPVTFERGVWSQ